MQEVLAKPGYENLPLGEQEFYELSLDDSEDENQPGFFVRQAHYIWSEIDRQFMFDDLQTEHSAQIKTARARYEVRRRALVEQGFSHSDMDF